MFKLFQGENWFWSSHFPWQHTFTPVIHIPQIHIPHIEVPSSCEVANASCLQQCGSVENMNFQCQEDHGVMSSCTCSSIQGGIQAGRSDTERCNEAKAVCESECGISRTAKFQCSDSGSSFSKSCSCSSTNSQSYYYQGPPHYYHYDYTPSFQGLGLESKYQDGDAANSYITRDHVAYHSQNSKDSDECKIAKHQCEAGCKGGKVDFDCDSNNGQLAQSCSCVAA
eukprot:TRINITY_DN3973_c0_g1_i4.p2 TRINITY_DN3973_c0_g1~~TRINITY_DN3973_c0_g1_i4.p2  ORF type:complete len:225 (+),score=23.84 TRINITY_DN3973_c0_g1_i4:134-808(+)